MLKRLKAIQIMQAMSRATPSNALKLTDPLEYKKVPYQNFFVEFIKPEFKDYSRELIKLQETMTHLLTYQDKYYFRTDKLYEYFILRLQAILGRNQ